MAIPVPRLLASTLLTALVCIPTAHAADRLRPYVLGSNEPALLAEKRVVVRHALEEQGFTIAGEYAPADGVDVLVVTSAELQQVAAATALGGYGAALRVGLTRVGEAVQVSYTNPAYMRAAYRLSGSLAGVATRLETALGRKQTFGSVKGLTEAELESYHYMVLMPFFTDQIVLARYDSQEAAVQAVEKGLAEGRGGTVRVYRVDVPGQKQSLFGVALTTGEGADKTILKTIDTAELRHVAHLPYEVLVADGAVRMLHGKFRIAQSWPDLTMGSFMQIGAAPDAIEAALGKAAGKK